MKVITYNLHKGRGRRRRSILADAVRALADRGPDVLACQEVFHGATDALHQCYFITEELGHEHAFGPNATYPRGCHGNATFAQMGIDRSVNIDATESRLEKRGILRTWLTLENTPLEVLNVHFSLTARQRRRQWSRLLDALPEDPQVPALVCGDFNDWRGGLDRIVRSAQALENALWTLPEPLRRSYPARRPVFALDRIYYRGLALRSIEVLRGPPWSQLSDHLPVEAIFELPPRRRT